MLLLLFGRTKTAKEACRHVASLSRVAPPAPPSYALGGALENDFTFHMPTPHNLKREKYRGPLVATRITQRHARIPSPVQRPDLTWTRPV